MAWYWILAIVLGGLLCMYFTGLIFYVHEAKDCDGVNLLTTKESTVQTERGELNVDGTKNNLLAFSTLAGILFPFTWVMCILALIFTAGVWILKPITNLIINKAK